jgi:hypothetical protein
VGRVVRHATRIDQVVNLPGRAMACGYHSRSAITHPMLACIDSNMCNSAHFMGREVRHQRDRVATGASLFGAAGDAIPRQAQEFE